MLMRLQDRSSGQHISLARQLLGWDEEEGIGDGGVRYDVAAEAVWQLAADR